ncbi:MAG: hypothetical protein E4G89_00365 [Methanothrix sp.]|nr:MAG: hypothetical protein E4G89_00365 [Methanothrix sp.]
MIIAKDDDDTIRLRAEFSIEELEALYVALITPRKTEGQRQSLKAFADELETMRPALRKLKPKDPPKPAEGVFAEDPGPGSA